jgi:hypothetical protein
MTEEQFHILEPYIYISESFQKKSDTLRYAEVEKRDTLAFYKYPEGTLIDLNRAVTVGTDTTTEMPTSTREPL